VVCGQLPPIVLTATYQSLQVPIFRDQINHSAEPNRCNLWGDPSVSLATNWILRPRQQEPFLSVRRLLDTYARTPTHRQPERDLYGTMETWDGVCGPIGGVGVQSDTVGDEYYMRWIKAGRMYGIQSMLRMRRAGDLYVAWVEWNMHACLLASGLRFR
jgi:hypothetical protein